MSDDKKLKPIKGMALYAAVQKPKTKYKRDGSKDPLDQIYSIDLVVDAKVHKEAGKRFPKQKKEPLTVDEFRKRYSMDPPENIERNSDDEVCMMSFKTNYAYKDKSGKTMLFPKPKVFFVNESGKLVEDTETLVGNGSIVTVQTSPYESKEYNTTSYKLKAIRVDDHVPYETEDYSELGDIDEGSLKDSGFTEAGGDSDDGDAPFDTEDNVYD